MKTFTKILTAAAATALLATSCVNEDPAYKNNEPGTPPDPNAKGYLTLADMSMRVVVDTDTETRPDDTSDETAKPQTRTDEAQPTSTHSSSKFATQRASWRSRRLTAI